MSTTETQRPPATGDGHVQDAEHEHPSDAKYVQIALILAVITAAEVLTYYVEDALGPALIPILMVMMVVKFVIVASWFMHLRFDSSLLTRIFYAGLVLAFLVYIAALAAFEFWA